MYSVYPAIRVKNNDLKPLFTQYLIFNFISISFVMWTSSKSPKYCIFQCHVFCNVNFQSQVLIFFYWMFYLCSGLTEYARNLNLKWKMGLIFVWLTWSLKATLWHRLIVCLFVFNIKEPTLFSVSVNSPTWPGHKFQSHCCRPFWLFAWSFISCTIFLLVQVVQAL